MKNLFFNVLFLNILAFVVSGYALTEQEAVVLGLQKNPDIIVSRLTLKADSLALASVNAGWLPQTQFTASHYWTLVDTTVLNNLVGANNASLTTSAGVTAQQVAPGGSVWKAGLQESMARYTKTDSALYGTTLSLNVSQPLLKNAFHYADLPYSIRMKESDSRQISLTQKKAILSTISKIRSAYWTLYGNKVVLKLFEDKIIYNQKKCETVRAKFMVGQATLVDTLSTTLELLDARRQLLEAQNSYSQVLQYFASILDTTENVISIDASNIPSVGSLPDRDRFMQQVLLFDPQLKVFETIKLKLQDQLGWTKNQRLPQLSFEAGYSYLIAGNTLFNDNKSYRQNAVIGLIAGYTLPAKQRRLTQQQNIVAQNKNDVQGAQYRKILQQQIDKLIQSWNLELQLIELSQASQEVAQRKLDAAQVGYSLGTVDLLSFQKAQQDYLDAAQRSLQNSIAMKQLEIIFDEITGSVLSHFQVSIE